MFHLWREEGWLRNEILISVLPSWRATEKGQPADCSVTSFGTRTRHRNLMTSATGRPRRMLLPPAPRTPGLSSGASGIGHLRLRRPRAKRGLPPAPGSRFLAPGSRPQPPQPPQPLSGPQAAHRYLYDSSGSCHLTAHGYAIYQRLRSNTRPRPLWAGPREGAEAVPKYK